MVISPEPRRSSAVRLIRFLRLVYAVPLGLAAAGIVGGFLLDNGWYIAAALAGFCLSVVAFALGAAARSVNGTNNPMGMRFVRQHGEYALAQIEHLVATGTEINNASVTELKLIVAPSAAVPFRATARQVIHPMHALNYQPGTIIVVRHSRQHPGLIAVESDPPLEWAVRARTERWHVGAVGPEVTPEPEDQVGTAAGRALMTVVGAAVVAAALLVPIREDVLNELVSPPDLFSADGVRGMVAKLSAESDRFQDITIYPDRVRATVTGARLTYRGGTVQRDETSVSVSDEKAKLFSPKDVNFDAIPGLIQRFGDNRADIAVRIGHDSDFLTITVQSTNRSERELVADAKGTPSLVADALTEAGFQQVSALLAAQSQRQDVYSMYITGDRVQFEVLGPAPVTSDEYTWRNGHLVEHQASSIQPREDDQVFPLAKVSPKAVAAIVATVKQRMPAFPLDKLSVSLYAAGGEWMLRSSAKDDYGRGFEVTSAPDGSALAVKTTGS